MITDPSSAEQVSAALADYLTTRRIGFAGFVEEPAPIGRGFDTFIYAFRIASNADLDPAWSSRLVARIYGSPARAPIAHHEAMVQRFAAGRGYPALVPLAVERPECVLGLPLMVMEFVPGGTAFDVLKKNPLRIGSMLAAVGELHARLHALDLDGCPLPYQGAFAERQLDAAREYIERVAPGRFDGELRWLEARRGLVHDDAPSLLHNDFHPLNVLAGAGRTLTVIDWTDAMLGDRHSDVGRTLALLWFAKIVATDRAERLALLLLRGLMRRRHIRGYTRRLPLDAGRLHYWETYHTLRACAQLAELASADASQLTEMARTLDPRLLDEAKARLSALIECAP